MAGRPTEYRPEFCELVITLGKDGASKAEMAAEIGVHRSTMDDWITVHAEFADALEMARTHSLAWWEKKARLHVVEDHQGQRLNAQLWGRSMGARFPADYREKSETKVEIGASLADLIAASYKPDAGAG